MRVAVCWGTLIRVVDVVKHNKKLFDEIDSDIKFDHFCQFWSKDNKYPYTLNSNINPDMILDFIPSEKFNDVSEVIDILKPKSVIINDFKDIATSNLKSSESDDITLLNLNHVSHMLSKAVTTNEAFSTIDNFKKFANLQQCYCFLINKLAQFYAFEQSVLLAKEYSQSQNFDYDVIIRIRYDVALILDNKDKTPIMRLTDQIYRSFNEDCLVVQEFFTKGLNSFYQRCVDNPTKQKGTKLNEYEMVDSCFLGSSNSMYKLANDFFKNVKSDFLFRCMQQDEESWCWPSTDKLWVNDILKKNIPCQTGELNKWLVIRNQTAFEKAKPFLSDYDNCLDFLDVYSHRLPVLDQNWIDRFIDLYFK